MNRNEGFSQVETFVCYWLDLFDLFRPLSLDTGSPSVIFDLSTCTAFQFHWELLLDIVQEKLMIFVLIWNTKKIIFVLVSWISMFSQICMRIFIKFEIGVSTLKTVCFKKSSFFWFLTLDGARECAGSNINISWVDNGTEILC